MDTLETRGRFPSEHPQPRIDQIMLRSSVIRFVLLSTWLALPAMTTATSAPAGESSTKAKAAATRTAEGPEQGMRILYPVDGTLFPPLRVKILI